MSVKFAQKKGWRKNSSPSPLKSQVAQPAEDQLAKTLQNADASLSARIETYLAQHGVTTEMNSSYMLDAFTLRNSENHSRLVFVMDAEKASGRHVHYKDYVNKTNQFEEPAELDVHEDRHFDYASRESHDSTIISIAKRFFSDRYRTSMPFMSADQKLVCMPRFSRHQQGWRRFNQGQDIIDVYDCSDESFWTSEKRIDIDDGFYLFSLNLGDKGHRNFKKMEFSLTNRYIAAQGVEELLIFEKESAMQTEINEGDLEADGVTKLVEPLYKFNVADRTYDRILGQYINEENIDKSWVILQSSQYEQVHLLPLQDILEDSKEVDLLDEDLNKKSLGGQFIQSSCEILFKLDINDHLSFWDRISTKFTLDGKQAILQTMEETYQLILNEDDPLFLKYAAIPYLKGKSTECYLRSDGDLLFCERDKEQSYLQFSSLQIQKSKDFSNTLITCTGQVDVKEAVEFEREDADGQMRKVFRVTAIRSNEELMSWEILDNSKERKYFRSANSSRLSTFRWPFYAYAYNQMGIVISPLADNKYVVHYQMPDVKNGRIQRMDFAYSGTLYVLVYTDEEEILYKIKVKQDFHKREALTEQLKNVSLIQHDVLKSKEQIDDDEICEKVLTFPKDKNITDMFVIEQELGLEKIENVLVVKRNEISIMIRHSEEEETIIKQYPHKIKSIQQINQNSFIVLEDGQNNLRLLTILYQGTSFYDDKLIFRENSYDIAKMLANKNNLYILSQNGSESLLRCFKLSQSKELVPTGTINNIAETYPNFIEEFEQSFTINQNILICSDNKFVKIYHNDFEEYRTSLQMYYNFLPDKTKKDRDRQMPIMNIRNCPKHNRVLLMFNYPESCKPKKILVIPNISDNRILTNHGDSSKDTVMWLSNKSLSEDSFLESTVRGNQTQVPSDASVTAMFQYKFERNILQEFDLVGMLTKQSFYSSEFDEKQILAMCNSKLRFLLTDEKETYLETLEIKEIMENHKCVTQDTIKMKEITITYGNRNLSLFDLMYDCKEKLKGTFSFQFNCKKEIMMACLLPRGEIFACFIINPKGNRHSAYQIYATEDQKHQFATLFASQRLMSVSSPDDFFRISSEDKSSQGYQKMKTRRRQKRRSDGSANKAFQEELINTIVKAFKYAKNFLISEEKVILWSRYNILHSQLSEIRIANLPDAALILKESQFQINRSLNISDQKKDTKSKSLFRRAKTDLKSKEDQSDIALENSEDFIDSIHARKKMITCQNENGDEVEYEQVVLKLRHQEVQVVLLQYVLDLDQEVTWMTGSVDTEVFYNSNGDFMVADPEQGIINLETKEVLHEYRLQSRNTKWMENINMSWGSKMVQTKEAKYIILPSCLLMPYSLLSVVQHFQAEAYDNKAANFYTEDYYKIDGQTRMHKFMYNPELLDKLLDDFWLQNKIYLTTVLVKQEIAQQRTQRQTSFTHLPQQLGKYLVTKNEEEKKQAAQEVKNELLKAQAGERVSYEAIEHIDTLDAQIEMNNDQLINKILYYLSCLPIQFSFDIIRPKLSDLCEYSRFYDYLDAWPAQTAQMKATRILFTDLEKGMNEIAQNCSYLTKNFFIEHPTEKPEQVLAEEMKESLKKESLQSQRSDFIDDDFIKQQSEDEAKVEKKASYDSANESRNLDQVSIHLMQVDWLTTTESGYNFLKVITTNDDCLRLFESKSTDMFVEYLWKVTRTHFVWHYFMPFLFFGFIPLMITAYMMQSEILGQQSAIAYFVYFGAIVTLIFGTITWAKTEIVEICDNGFKAYFKNVQNAFQWAMIGFNTTLIVQAILTAGFIDDFRVEYQDLHTDDKRDISDMGYMIKTMRVNLIVSIVLNLLELFSRVRIFKFFAYFVRQLTEICSDAMPLATMLSLIVLAQTLLFWILDMNTNDPQYAGLVGFANCLIDSYRLALGDFEIAESFNDNMENEVVFWIIFFCGTLISLLIILNMVIAVMGGTFERVSDKTEAHILREKLILILDNLHRMSPSIKDQLASFKYLLEIEVDPEIDPIQQDSSEKRLAQEINGLKTSLASQDEKLGRIQLNLDTLYDKLCTEDMSVVRKGTKKRARMDDHSESSDGV